VPGAELLTRLASSDERAWSEFYGMVAPQLGKLAAHRGAVDPEDVVQDAMVRFVAVIRANRLRIDSLGDVHAYLNTLVSNLVIDRYRRAKARCSSLMVPLDEFMVPIMPVAPIEVEAREEAAIHAQCRQRALARWNGSEQAKAVYVACVLEGRGVSEVAAELGIPPNTVSQLKRRAIKRARNLAGAAA